MALIPFIGRVLSHVNAEVEPVTLNLFHTRFVRGKRARPNYATQRTQKRSESALSSTHSRAKNGSRMGPHMQPSGPLTATRDQDHIGIAERRRNYVCLTTKSQKRSSGWSAVKTHTHLAAPVPRSAD